MKFEDLKLHDWQNSYYQLVAEDTARAVYDQMREYYEGGYSKKQPATVEYVPLGPEDVPPGSAVRLGGYHEGWAAVVGVEEWGLHMADSKESWASLAEDHVILRPDSTNWEPCKKPKA